MACTKVIQKCIRAILITVAAENLLLHFKVRAILITVAAENLPLHFKVISPGMVTTFK